MQEKPLEKTLDIDDNQMFVNDNGELKYKMSGLSFFVKGIKQGMFEELCINLSYFKK